MGNDHKYKNTLVLIYINDQYLLSFSRSNLNLGVALNSVSFSYAIQKL